MEENKLRVGLAIKLIREILKLSCKDLAIKTEISAATLCQIEAGQSSPSIKSLEKIATTLNITVGKLIQVAELITPLQVEIERIEATMREIVKKYFPDK